MKLAITLFFFTFFFLLFYFTLKKNTFDREQFPQNKMCLKHLNSVLYHSAIKTCVSISLCAPVFSRSLKGYFTLLMTFMCDNRWEYQHIVFVFMEMNYCFGIKTCTSCWAHNTPLVFVGNISWLCSTIHILFGHFDDSAPFACINISWWSNINYSALSNRFQCAQEWMSDLY